MNIVVEFIGFPELKNVIEKKSMDVDFPGNTFSDLLKHLQKKYKENFKKAVLDSNGNVEPTVQILKNEKSWVKRDSMSLEIQEMDKIIFLRMMGGG